MSSIHEAHCQNCGSTRPEDVDPFANQGYSSCCNERIVPASSADCDPTECFHFDSRQNNNN